MKEPKCRCQLLRCRFLEQVVPVLSGSHGESHGVLGLKHIIYVAGNVYRNFFLTEAQVSSENQWI